MNDDLTQRLLSAESDFLVALQTGAQMLSSYDQTWSTLLGVLHTAPKTKVVGTETLSLADHVASRISIVSSCFLDLGHDEDSFTTSLQSDWDAVYRQLATLDLNEDSNSSHPPDIRRSPSQLRSLTPETESPSPPFLTSVYQWLLDNLHNPYPTPAVKSRIATSSSCQVSSINSWFTNARRRIGWTTLCRERFSNCRRDMLDAAYRALVKEDPQRILSPEIRHSFVTMKVTAENLYSTFTRSAFTGDLDALIENPIVRTSVGVGGCLQHAETIRDSYPSPDQSVSASPAPGLDNSLTDESEEEEDVVPPTLAGSKRRRANIDAANQCPSVGRPIKRLRTSNTSPMCLPSPPTSADGTDTPSGNGSPGPSPTRPVPPETNKVLSPRGQRPCDTDVAVLPKRRCGAMAASDARVMSPVLRSNPNDEYSIDDWFNGNFDTLFAMPPPVEAAQPDSSALWDVELFRGYSTRGDANHISNHAPAPAADDRVSVPTDLSDLDDLLQSIGGETFAAPGTMHTSDISGIPYTTSFGSSIPDTSQTTISWTSLLNSTEVSQHNICSAFPQYPIDSQPLPEIDLSVLQLPPIIPISDTQADLASKYTKLHQLHAMQEVVRRIEQELQSEGVTF